MAPIVVTGACGQLGYEMCRLLGGESVGLSSEHLDVSDRGAVLRVLEELRPRAVVNCAAYTQVDRAEQDAGRCWAVNADALAYLAGWCDELECPLVHISTDYVFGGDVERRQAYAEYEVPAPLNEYGRSKLAGESNAKRCAKHIVVRSCGLYGRAAPGRPPRNFVETMLRLAQKGGPLRVVDDQRCTPTHVESLAQATLYLLRTEAYGLWHVTDAGETTWYDLAVEIMRCEGLGVPVERISSEEFGSPVNRPSYSVLNTCKYAALDGPRMPAWQESLRNYLQSRDRRAAPG